MAFSSRRVYQYSHVNGSTIQRQTLRLDHMITPDREDDTEIKYAMQDEIDQVLDLKIGESMYISANRDTPDETKGILLRIQ